MKNIILYAPPAAGKGTQCEFLKNEFGYEIISIGQVLRNQRNPETEVGRAIIKSQDEGVLTPDDIVVKALQNELNKINGPIVIEGFPRNIKQAKLLDDLIDNYIVINLSIDRDIAMKRALGRLNCDSCGQIHNIYFNELKPRVEGICNNCGAKLNVRTDDNADSFNKRFDVYEENRNDILEYYNRKDILFIIDSNQDKNKVSKEIKELIK